MKTIREEIAAIKTTQYFLLALWGGHVGLTYIPLLLAILL